MVTKISIDRVYQRVLLLANKEQRGYITPEEFNSFANQAQLEVFESYFLKKFQANQAPETTDDYSDVAANVEEKITFFDNVASLSGPDDTINIGGATDVFAYPADFYRLAQVSVAGREGFPIMADEVSHNDLTYINLSPLTRPTQYQPVFTRHEGGVVVYPRSIENINIIYTRKPADPVWGYMDDPTGEPVNNPATTTDFEIHPSDEQELVYKILTLAGVAIKQADLAQFGSGKEQQLAATEG